MITLRLEDETFLKDEDVRPGYAGSIGARAMMAAADPEDPFGCPDIDWGPAFARAIAFVRSKAMARGPRSRGQFIRHTVDLRTRAVWNSRSPWEITAALAVLGDYVTLSNMGTRVRFHACAGLKLTKVPNVPNAPPDYFTGSANLQGLCLEYVRPQGEIDPNPQTPQQTAGPEAMRHGFEIRWMSRGDELQANGFPGHGLLMDSSVYGAEPSSASCSRYSDLAMYNCGRSGIRINGHDTNAYTVARFQCIGNGRLWLPDDCYGVHSTSQLGGTIREGHTRGNRLAGYRMGRYLGVSPNQDTLEDCYSEHSVAGADPLNFQEGPGIIDGNCNVRASLLGAYTGRSIVSSGPGVPRGLTESVSQNAREYSGASRWGRYGGSLITIGAEPAVPPADGTAAVRSFLDLAPDAYGAPTADPRTFLVHDSYPEARAFGFKQVPARGAFQFAWTDHTHARPHKVLLQAGALFGNGLTPPGILGNHDPAFELPRSTPPVISVAQSLEGVYPHTKTVTNPDGTATTTQLTVPGDQVLSKNVSAQYPFPGWVCVKQADGTRKWHRMAPVHATPIDYVPPPPPPPPPEEPAP